jgi:hypothetical protein
MSSESIKIRIIKNISGLLLLIIGILVSFNSCEEEAIYTPEERFVLQAYLYANEPVWDVTVKNAVPLTVADSVGEPINDAVITLYKNSMAYNLVSSSDSGTYYYPGNDLSIETGDEFTIEASVGERMATANTSVPDSPKGVIMSMEKIELPEINVAGFDFTAIRALREAQQAVELEVLWDNPNGELFFVVVENNENSQESIFPDLGGNFDRLGGKGAFRRISAPTRESSFQINFMDIRYWGKYVVKVYRVNQEYADLYDNLEQDSRDLNDPPTNIKNGLGIFSAFHSQNVYFEVVKQ